MTPSTDDDAIDEVVTGQAAKLFPSFQVPVLDQRLPGHIGKEVGERNLAFGRDEKSGGNKKEQGRLHNG